MYFQVHELLPEIWGIHFGRSSETVLENATLTSESKRYRKKSNENKVQCVFQGGRMTKLNRRRWLESMGLLAAAGSIPVPKAAAQLASPEGSGKMKLDLSEFQPKSMLHVPETKVPRAKYPVIDIHTHLSITAKSVNGVGIGEQMDFLATPETLLPVMDSKNIRMMVNLTGGSGAGLDAAVEKFQRAHPDRFLTFTEPWWERTNQPGYSKFQAEEIARARKAGARGLKVLKCLGV